MKTTKWLGVRFESDSVKTQQFLNFARDFRADLRSICKNTRWMVWEADTNHFYISGFFKNIDTGKFIYFSISDVRFFQDEWYSNMLIRSAGHDADYTGGMNHYTALVNLDHWLNTSENWK